MNKVALVTGASSGIGKIACMIGFTVTVCSRGGLLRFKSTLSVWLFRIHFDFLISQILHSQMDGCSS